MLASEKTASWRSLKSSMASTALSPSVSRTTWAKSIYAVRMVQPQPLSSPTPSMFLR